MFRDGDEVEIGSRNERPMARYFPEVVAAVARSLPPRCVVDGEIVVAGDGRLDFFSLQQRIHPAASRVDLLAAETPGELRRLRPARARRRRPHAAAVRRAPGGAGVARSVTRAPPVHLTPITRDPELAREWFERFEGAGLDGIIAKRAEQTYQPDKRVMTKIKHVRTADCVVAGYRVHKSGPDAIGSLMLGLYDEDAAVQALRLPVGVVGAFPMARRRELFTELQPLVCDVRGPPVELGARALPANAASAAAGTRARRCRSSRCGPSACSRSATTTWRARASGTRRSSSAGARTAIRARAATTSSIAPSTSTWPRSSGSAASATAGAGGLGQAALRASPGERGAHEAPDRLGGEGDDAEHGDEGELDDQRRGAGALGGVADDGRGIGGRGGGEDGGGRGGGDTASEHGLSCPLRFVQTEARPAGLIRLAT